MQRGKAYIQYEPGTALKPTPTPQLWSDELCETIIALEAELLEGWRQQVAEREVAQAQKKKQTRKR